MERSVDVETFLALEEENLLTQFRKKVEPAIPTFDINTFFRKLSKKASPAEKASMAEPEKNTSLPYNHYTQKAFGQLESKTTVTDKKSGLMGWVEENPGTALLGSLLLAGAACWLYEIYGKKKNHFESREQEENKRSASTGRGKRNVRRLTARDKKKEENVANGIEAKTEENNDAPETAMEQPGVLTMAASTAGGVIAGKILPEYRIIGAIATGAYAISKSDITTACIAAGLFFSPLIVETVQGLITNLTGSPKKKVDKNPSATSIDKKEDITSISSQQEKTPTTQATSNIENIGEISPPDPNLLDRLSEPISENQPSTYIVKNDLIESLKR